MSQFFDFELNKWRTLDFDPNGHKYTLDDEIEVPSVTHIIHETVPTPFNRAAWWGYKSATDGSGQTPDQKRNQAAARGTLVHKAFAEMLSGQEPDEDKYKEVTGYLVALERFFEDNDPFASLVEHQILSLKHMYAGTVDARLQFGKGKYKDQYATLDLKSGRVYPESHWPQLEAYENALVEDDYQPTDLRLILAVTPTGKYRLVKSLDSFDDFKILLDHYRSIEARKFRRKDAR